MSIKTGHKAILLERLCVKGVCRDGILTGRITSPSSLQRIVKLLMGRKAQPPIKILSEFPKVAPQSENVSHRRGKFLSKR
jgi:hypothetical protein